MAAFLIEEAKYLVKVVLFKNRHFVSDKQKRSHGLGFGSERLNSSLHLYYRIFEYFFIVCSSRGTFRHSLLIHGAFINPVGLSLWKPQLPSAVDRQAGCYLRPLGKQGVGETGGCLLTFMNVCVCASVHSKEWICTCIDIYECVCVCSCASSVPLTVCLGDDITAHL